LKQKQVHESLYRASVKLENCLEIVGEKYRSVVKQAQADALGILEKAQEQLFDIIAANTSNKAKKKAGLQIDKL